MVTVPETHDNLDRLVQLTTSVIDYAALVEQVRTPAAGSVILFLGTVRDLSEGRPVLGLTYEAFVPMAQHQLEQLTEAAQQQWPINRLALIHRYGHLELGDIAVAIAIATPHRAEGFAAAQWLMQRIKEVVPIWKQEHWADGSATWIHPIPKSPL